MMTDRFLIVGLGSIGRRHAANLRNLRPRARIAALRSNSASPRREAPPAIDEEFESWPQAIAFAPTAAIICNPAPFHIEAASALLACKVPMLIEKPLADRLAGAAEFVTMAERVGTPLAVGYDLRLSPTLLKTRDLLASGAIGQVHAARAEVGQYLPDWRPQSRYQDGVSAQRRLGGGPLLELSHEIDYICWLFGVPSEVTATGGKMSDLETDVDDLVDLSLRYTKPARHVNIHLDFLQRSPSRHCRFIGSDGTLVWNAIAETIDLYRVPSDKHEHFHLPAVDGNRAYLDELSQFFDLVAGKKGTLATLAEACDVLKIVEAAEASLARKQTVGIDGLERAAS